MKNPVGPILRMGDEVEQVIAAIEDDNPDTDIEVIDRGAYVRVQGEDRITVTEQTLRRYLGADFEIASFGTMMSAFSGARPTCSRPAGPRSSASEPAAAHTPARGSWCTRTLRQRSRSPSRSTR